MSVSLLLKTYRLWFGAAGAALLLVVGLFTVTHFVKAPPGAGPLPEFPDEDISARKQAFFDFLRPIAKDHNERIREDREELQALAAQESLGYFDRRRLASLAEKYFVDIEELDDDEALELLQRRVDTIPEALVLVQAAKESGWGRSRFAREGNALFGEWCYNEGCGIVPGARGEGRTHEVRAFDTVYDAVGSYIRNLNTHRSYLDLRLARQAARESGEAPSAFQLAEHLSRYSERGDVYVREIQSMIRQNDLEDVPAELLRAAPSAARQDRAAAPGSAAEPAPADQGGDGGAGSGTARNTAADDGSGAAVDGSAEVAEAAAAGTSAGSVTD
ncbi:MAG: glucosaminidase domain-containing protein [Woeseia sp.]